MRRTILVADDSPTIQRLVAETFADADFDIVSVSNGDAAIRKLEEVHPDVILADVFMPGKNGYELCAYVQHNAALQDTPVILLAGAYDVFDEVAAAGAACTITKPFEPQALADLVSAVLASAEERAAARQSAGAPVEDADLLGLGQIFSPEPPPPAPVPALTSDEIDRIADRVIQRLSSQVVESIAWNVVPDIAEKIVREEVKRAGNS